MTGTDNLRRGNAGRSAQACLRDAGIAAEALRLAPPHWPPAYLNVARARQQMPRSSWSEVAASIGMTKAAATATFRRIRKQLAPETVRDTPLSPSVRSRRLLMQRRRRALAKIRAATAALEQVEREMEEVARVTGDLSILRFCITLPPRERDEP